ncbi:MAG TPA: hypothetical protein VHX44_01960, partial [Planctomycetota bacterium]|nr:hypothetical protein [Planctomycetota bacterium]
MTVSPDTDSFVAPTPTAVPAAAAPAEPPAEAKPPRTRDDVVKAAFQYRDALLSYSYDAVDALQRRLDHALDQLSPDSRVLYELRFRQQLSRGLHARQPA